MASNIRLIKGEFFWSVKRVFVTGHNWMVGSGVNEGPASIAILLPFNLTCDILTCTQGPPFSVRELCFLPLLQAQLAGKTFLTHWVPLRKQLIIHVSRNVTGPPYRQRVLETLRRACSVSLMYMLLAVCECQPPWRIRSLSGMAAAAAEDGKQGFWWAHATPKSCCLDGR